MQGLVAAIDGRSVELRAALDVQVEPSQVELVDDLLVGRLQAGHRSASLSELGTRLAPEGDDDVAAHRAQAIDVTSVAVPREARTAIPGRGARAIREDECQRPELVPRAAGEVREIRIGPSGHVGRRKSRWEVAAGFP